MHKGVIFQIDISCVFKTSTIGIFMYNIRSMFVKAIYKIVMGIQDSIGIRISSGRILNLGKLSLRNFNK